MDRTILTYLLTTITGRKDDLTFPEDFTLISQRGGGGRRRGQVLLTLVKGYNLSQKTSHLILGEEVREGRGPLEVQVSRSRLS